MKTLYISDLDGTLLNEQAELSEYTIQALNAMMDMGMAFSVATARTAATCNRMLHRLHLNIPIVLMNGVLVYDFQNKRYIKKELLTDSQVNYILCAMENIGQTGLMYGLSDDELSTYYDRIPNDAVRAFIEERVTKFGKKFTKVRSLADVKTDVIYFCCMDTSDNIHRLYDAIKSIPHLRIEKYQDIYSDGDLWYMEIFSGSASKYNAVMFLRRAYGFDSVVAFGDNLNDLPLFEASDRCYAVANAKDAVKSQADGIIGTNKDDGVVRWMEQHFHPQSTVKSTEPNGMFKE